MTDTQTLYKLIILKMLEQADSPLSGSQISEFILGKEYTNYFTLQQILSELADSELVTVSARRNRSMYHITENGRHTLDCLSDDLPDAFRKDISTYLTENKIEIRDSLSKTADYFMDSQNDYLVRCQVRELDSILIELTISVPSEKQAISVCNHWEIKSQEIYAHIMKNLL